MDNLMKAIVNLELAAKDLVQAANKVDMDPMEIALKVVEGSVIESIKSGVKTPLIPPTPPQPNNNNSSDSDESEYPSGSDESESENDSRYNRFYRKLCGY